LHVIVPHTAVFGSSVPPDQTTLDLVVRPSLLNEASELLRCCLGRTLLSYNGQSTRKGGADLRPDLAIGSPQVSVDGLTWTFHLRPNLHYAPPLQNTEITSTDFVRILQRVARLSQGGSQYPYIVGFDEYAKGTTASIAGLETPDAHTLVVRLTHPEGDLAYALSVPEIAPLPPSPNDPSAPYGIAAGHDDGDSSFLVSSGPYMLEGGDKVDLSVAPAQQHGASGLVAGKSITLVRNPSWNAADDPLRAAYVDRIAIGYGGTVDDAVAGVDAGKQDIIIAISPPPQVPLTAINAYRANPGKGRIDIEPRDGVRYISMNLAMPPFNDIHVRRAVAFALDRKAIVQAFGGDVGGAVTGHLALDSMEDNALVDYDPYRTPDAGTRLRMAQQEMARSAYDSRHTGACDAPVCQHIEAVALSVGQVPAAMSDVVRNDLEAIGLHLEITGIHGPEFFKLIGDPTQKVPLALFWGFFKDYPNGGDFFGNYSKDAIGQNNVSLLGAAPEQLRGWGYTVTSVPSVDDRLNSCFPLVGAPQTRCWVSVDQYLMENVVAVVPVVAETYVELVPKWVVNYSYDQSQILPALEQIAIAH
jgi:peptide/nickel transport system substrate-binding protein